ncbi:hypothetical protein [Komagataeibacter kakiaceti]|uniref:hypothetical protein n=1 Tax=Komagataeibacter kakiaceti TaxID=943261 RepID=UPI0011DDCC3A|nr:hypothetical protein [Komagataeibacter kakiaceti]
MLTDLFSPYVLPADTINPAGKRTIWHALQKQPDEKTQNRTEKWARSCDLSRWKDHKSVGYTKSLQFRTISKCEDSFQPPPKHKKYIQWKQSILKKSRECKRILEFSP